jgi:hypothetical protein
MLPICIPSYPSVVLNLQMLGHFSGWEKRTQKWPIKANNVKVGPSIFFEPLHYRKLGSSLLFPKLYFQHNELYSYLLKQQMIKYC